MDEDVVVQVVVPADEAAEGGGSGCGCGHGGGCDALFPPLLPFNAITLLLYFSTRFLMYKNKLKQYFIQQDILSASQDSPPTNVTNF